MGSLFNRRDLLRGAAGMAALAGWGCSDAGEGDAPPFSLLDAGPEELRRVNRAIVDYQRDFAERVLAMLRSLDGLRLGFPVSQLEHMRQAATRALRAGAGDDWVLAALLHDVAKAVSYLDHAAVGAALLRPYLPEPVHAVLHHHQVFQNRHTAAPGSAAALEFEGFRGEPWFADALRFSGEWDAPAFEPGYPSLSLAEFEPLVRTALARPRFQATPQP